MKQDVNVIVGGPINGAAPCQYKTKILKANIPFKDQVEGEANENTKFVIKWDFLLTDNVTIPDGCILEFDGGTIGNKDGNSFHIDFSRSFNTKIYYSWFSDFVTCNACLPYLDTRPLVLDRTITLTQPFTNEDNGVNFSAQIEGVCSNEYERGTIIYCESCAAFKFYGKSCVFKDLVIVPKGMFNESVIQLYPKRVGKKNGHIYRNGEIDCTFMRCQFRYDYGSASVWAKFNTGSNYFGVLELHGRGAQIEDCLFQVPLGYKYPTGSGYVIPERSVNTEKRFPILLVSELEYNYNSCTDNYEVETGLNHNAKTSNRNIVIKNNHYHNGQYCHGYFIGMIGNNDFYNIADMPDAYFLNTIIEGNRQDIGNCLAYILAKNSNTVIVNNHINNREADGALLISNAEDMLILNNTFTQKRVAFGPTPASDIGIWIRNGKEDSVRGLNIINNVFGSTNGSISIYSELGLSPVQYSVENILIKNNVYTDAAFERIADDVPYGVIGSRGIIMTNTHIKNCVIKNNIIPEHEVNGNVVLPYALYANAAITLDTILITDNIGFDNTIKDGAGVITRTNIHEDYPTSGTFNNKPTDASIPVGFKYFCTNKWSPESKADGLEIIYKGNGVWVDSLGRTVDSTYPNRYIGAFDDRPADLISWNAGHKYYDTTNNRYIIWNGTVWTDAVGNPVEDEVLEEQDAN